MFGFFKKNFYDTQIEPGPKILREAAWNFLEDNIKIANNLVKKAMKIQPEYFFDHKKTANNLISELKYAVKNGVKQYTIIQMNIANCIGKQLTESQNHKNMKMLSMVFHSIMRKVI